MGDYIKFNYFPDVSDQSSFSNDVIEKTIQSQRGK